MANSNVFQRSVLLPWRAMDALLGQVNRDGTGEETVMVRTEEP